MCRVKIGRAAFPIPNAHNEPIFDIIDVETWQMCWGDVTGVAVRAAINCNLIHALIGTLIVTLT